MPEYYIESIEIKAEKAFDTEEEAREYLRATGTAGDVWFHWKCEGHKHVVSIHAVQESLVLQSEVANLLAHVGAACTILTAPEVQP